MTRRLSDHNSVVLAFSAIALIYPIGRYVRIRFGELAILHDGQVWRRVARSVLAGEPLYIAVPDNKPPLWEFIVIVAEWTGEYALVLLLLVGIGNALLVWLAGAQFRERHGVAIIASLGCLLLLTPLVTWTNNKSLATACLLLVTVVDRPRRGGILIGAAVGIAQQTVLGVPAVLWLRKQEGWGRSAIQQALGVAAGVVATSYVLVGVIWGWDSLRAAIQQTVFAVLGYGTGTSQFQTTGGLLHQQLVWHDRIAGVVLDHQVLLLLALTGGISIVVSWRQRRTADRFWIIYLLSTGPVIALRAYRHYWVLLAAGISACVGIGSESLITKLTESE